MYDTPRVATCGEFFEQTGKNRHHESSKVFFFFFFLSDVVTDVERFNWTLLLLFILMHFNYC